MKLNFKVKWRKQRLRSHCQVLPSGLCCLSANMWITRVCERRIGSSRTASRAERYCNRPQKRHGSENRESLRAANGWPPGGEQSRWRLLFFLKIKTKQMRCRSYHRASLPLKQTRGVAIKRDGDGLRPRFFKHADGLHLRHRDTL